MGAKTRQSNASTISQNVYTEVDAFTFVPSTRWSLIKRGFNPAELIARELAES